MVYDSDYPSGFSNYSNNKAHYDWEYTVVDDYSDSTSSPILGVNNRDKNYTYDDNISMKPITDKVLKKYMAVIIQINIITMEKR